MGSQITFQDATGVDQSLPASGASTPGPAIGDTGDENQPTGEPSRSPRMAPVFTWIFLSPHQLRVPMTSEMRSAARKH